jgi:hypothetical protein
MRTITVPIHPYEDDIPAFALGAIDPEEALQIKEHLAQCLACLTELAAYRMVVGLLCYANPLQEPPIYLKERILTHFAIEAESCALTSS